MSQIVQLGDEIELLYGKSLPQRVRNNGEFPVYGSNGQVDSHDQFLIRGPGIIVGRKGSVGEVEWSDKNFWPIDTTYYAKPKNSSDYLRYWYYQLKVLGLEKLNTHSAIPGLNRETAYKKQILKRSPDEQKEIVAILESLDAKIELNRRMNKTLEQIGQAMFTHSFVKHPDAEKWNVCKLSDVSSYISRGISPKYDDDGQYLVVNQRCVRDKRLNFTNARRQSKRFGDEKYLRTGDVLINSTGVGTLGRVAQVDKVPSHNVTFDSHITVVRPAVNKYFFGEMMRRLQPIFENMASGTTGQTELSRATVSDLELTIPPKHMIEEFSENIEPLRARMFFLDEENATLSATRDTLLPRLISGQIKP